MVEEGEGEVIEEAGGEGEVEEGLEGGVGGGWGRVGR